MCYAIHTATLGIEKRLLLLLAPLGASKAEQFSFEHLRSRLLTNSKFEECLCTHAS